MCIRRPSLLVEINCNLATEEGWSHLTQKPKLKFGRLFKLYCLIKIPLYMQFPGNFSIMESIHAYQFIARLFGERRENVMNMKLRNDSLVQQIY